ncbi:hypothetical protein GLAREA_10140 [Glarea lozoyensis ATCC 20868]|uniref:Uncharacterized protein n=1 Tax=Glarea lozoyensis (strain ATCC 20868 / MF5171) TaxID=1116229 RepID=S3DQZ4_GLAL2|nr:uncharacterized protein GLAREA_10140 [Glarea lozoyensis ATCC 20868]EPE34446.1 hypothetical protein GLAREA_10140 [Glarea lozoyensis ATCC 20868]
MSFSKKPGVDDTAVGSKYDSEKEEAPVTRQIEQLYDENGEPLAIEPGTRYNEDGSWLGEDPQDYQNTYEEEKPYSEGEIEELYDENGEPLAVELGTRYDENGRWLGEDPKAYPETSEGKKQNGEVEGVERADKEVLTKDNEGQESAREAVEQLVRPGVETKTDIGVEGSRGGS